MPPGYFLIPKPNPGGLPLKIHVVASQDVRELWSLLGKIPQDPQPGQGVALRLGRKD